MGEEIELREYFAVVWKWLWLILLGTLLAGGTAYIVSKNMIPIYRASTTLLISQAGNPSMSDYQSILTGERLAKTYAELLTKRPILEEVAARLEMKEGKFPDELDVKPIRGTQLIELRVEHEDPRLAAEIANTLPEVFIERNRSIQSSRFASSKENLEKQLATLKRDIETTQRAINDLQGSESAADQVELTRLQTSLTQYRNSYADLLSRYEEIRLAEVQTMDNVVVVEPAEIPLYPVKPHPLLNTLLASVTGAMLAVGVAFLIEYLDDTIKSSEEVRRALGLSTLGNIPRFHADEDPLITTAHPRSPVSEAYRTLRTNIHFSAVGNPLEAILVSSASPLEGKSITLANLGAVMAQAGLSTVIVDSDLRRSALHELFGLSNSYGLSNALLREDPDLDDFLQATEVENLKVLTSGSLPPNPSELLGSQRMENLIQKLKDQADVLLFDSPPALAVTDAALLANRVEGVLLVVEAGKARREVVQRAEEELNRVGANLMGVVLNKLPAKGARYYYYYREEGKRRKRKRSPRRWAWAVLLLVVGLLAGALYLRGATIVRNLYLWLQWLGMR